MPGTPRKSLADKVKENEAAKTPEVEENNNSLSVVSSSEEPPKEDVEVNDNPPPVDFKFPNDESSENDEDELTPDVKGRIAAHNAVVAGSGLITHSGGGSVTVPAAEGTNLTNTPGETALARKKPEMEHVYAQPVHEVE